MKRLVHWESEPRPCWDELDIAIEFVPPQHGSGYRAYFPKCGYSVNGVGCTPEDALANLREGIDVFEQQMRDEYPTWVYRRKKR